MSSPGDSKGHGGMGMNMVTTVMAFSVSAFFVLFVFLRLLCARLRLRTDRAAAHAGDAFVVQAYNVERGIHGLEPSVVRSFPTVKLADGSEQPTGQEESQCPVCLEEYAAKDVVRVLPACGHAFHAACIDAWLRQHPTCPVCRASLRATAKSNHRATATATLLEYSLAVESPPASRSQQVIPASSSGDTAGHTHTAQAERLEIVLEEPGSSADQEQNARVVGRSGCGETARQSASGHS